MSTLLQKKLSNILSQRSITRSLIPAIASQTLLTRHYSNMRDDLIFNLKYRPGISDKVKEDALKNQPYAEKLTACLLEIAHRHVVSNRASVPFVPTSEFTIPETIHEKTPPIDCLTSQSIPYRTVGEIYSDLTKAGIIATIKERNHRKVPGGHASTYAYTGNLGAIQVELTEDNKKAIDDLAYQINPCSDALTDAKKFVNHGMKTVYGITNPSMEISKTR